MKYTRRFASFLCLSALAGCAPSIASNGCEWVDQMPKPNLCEPGQDPVVDENLIAQCTALTGPMGDWLLALNELGKENCNW